MILDSRLFRSLSYATQRRVIAPSARENCSKFLTRLRPTHANMVHSGLSQNGFEPMGSMLTAAQIRAIREHLGNGPLFEPYHREYGHFDLNTVPQGAHLGQYMRDAVLGSPDLLALANHPAVIAKAAAIIGCKPTLTDLLSWWSFPGPQTPVDSQLWHRDRADWRMVKLFVYLTDVDSSSGPHVYMKNTVDKRDLIEIRRFTESEVKSHFADDAITAVGAAGSAFMTNPQGLHRASLPVNAPRLVFEATYSLCGLPEQNYLPYRYRKIKASSLPPGADPWINRFWIDR